MRRIHSRPTGVPVVVVAGMSAEPMIAATIAMQWDLPSVAVVQHAIDPVREQLVRTVSDVTGLIEREEIDVEHACTSCAIREDVIPTLDRLAKTGRWESLIAQLPLTAEPMQVCRVVEEVPGAAAHIRIGAVVAALDGADLVEDLTGQDLIAQRDLPVRQDDPRGVAETTAALVEYADLITIFGDSDEQGKALVQALARPNAHVADAMQGVATATLLNCHCHLETEEFVSPVGSASTMTKPASGVWRLDFRSERPFHPVRLKDNIAQLGGGSWRSRGCFWLASRPQQLCQWEGAGGMLSIGRCDEWDLPAPFTRIVVVGTGDGQEALDEALHSCLLTDEELRLAWQSPGDGLEPWLGPVDSQVQ